MADTRKDVGEVTAYAYAVAGGYTGTKEEFAALMASYATVAEEAAESAEAAAGSASTAVTAMGTAVSAKDAAVAAQSAAESAQTAAESAKDSATTAKTSAESAATSADASKTAAQTARTGAESARDQAVTAKDDAVTARTAAQSAQTAAEIAQGLAEDAQSAAETAQAAAEAAAQTLVIDDTLTQVGQAAEAKATGDEITALKDDLNARVDSVIDGENLLVPYQILTDVLYTTGGTVISYSGAVTYVYELANKNEYTVKNINGDSLLFGLSNSLYTGSNITVGKKYNISDANTTTFINDAGYLYLYITKSTTSETRKINVLTPIKGAYDNTLKVAEQHLNLLYSSSDDKTGGYIKSDTGEVVNVSGFYCTDYIDITGLHNLVLLMPVLTASTTKAGLAFYDSAKNYMSGVMSNVSSAGGSEKRAVAIPDNAAYMRTSCRVTAWSEFYVSIDDVYINAQAIEALNQEKPSNYGIQMFAKIGVIGDSISVGWARDKNGNNSRRNTDISWPQQMARRLGCTAYNLGASGVDPVEWFQPEYEFAQYCYTQYQSVGFCDLYIIGLGLNPTSSLGSVSDIKTDYTQNAATFYGQYARIIQMINAEHPDAIVMCLTEPTTNISNYDTAVRNICGLSYINAELVDLDANYRSLFTTAAIEAEKQPDGLHYTPYGYSLIAEAMVSALNDYIAKNTANFKYVGVANVN